MRAKQTFILERRSAPVDLKRTAHLEKSTATANLASTLMTQLNVRRRDEARFDEVICAAI